MPRCVEHRDHPAHGVPEDDRPGDADRVAERPHVVGALFEAPPVRVGTAGSAVVPQIEVDDLATSVNAVNHGLK